MQKGVHTFFKLQKRVKSYQYTKKILVILFCIYITFIMSAPMSRWVDSCYPLSLWRLWSSIPNKISKYELYIDQMGQFVNWESIDIFKSNAHDKQSAVILESWASVLQYGKKEEQHSNRKFIEGRLLNNKKVKYRLVRKDLDPIQYWKNKSLGEEVILGEFDAGSN